MFELGRRRKKSSLDNLRQMIREIILLSLERVILAALRWDCGYGRKPSQRICCIHFWCQAEEMMKPMG